MYRPGVLPRPRMRPMLVRPDATPPPEFDIVDENRAKDAGFQIAYEAHVRALASFLTPPGEEFFDLENLTVVAALAFPQMGVIIDTDSPADARFQRRDGMVITGVTTSGTTVNVRYRLSVNEAPLFVWDHQLTPNLDTFYPLSLMLREGPYRVKLEAGLNSGAGATNVTARIAGYWFGGTPEHPRRFKR